MEKSHQTKFLITAENRAQVAFDALKRQMESVAAASVSLKSALSAIGLGLSIGAITSAISGMVQYRGALDDLADTTGDSVETLSGLARTAKLSGVSLEELAGPLTKLARSLGDAGEEGKAAEGAVKAIGLSVTELRAQKPAEAFLEIANALGQYADGQDKIRVAQALFGKEGARILPLLKDLAEAGVLQGKVTTEQAAQADKLEKSWRLITANSDALKNSLISDLIPAIAKATDEMLIAQKAGGGLAAAIAGWQTLITGDDQVKNDKRLSELVDQQLRLERQIAEAGDPNRPFRGVRVDKLREQLRVVNEELKTTMAFRQVLENPISKRPEIEKRALDFKGGSGAPKGAGEADPFSDVMKRIAAEKAGLETEKNFYVEIATLLKEDKKLREALTDEQKKKVLQAAAEVAQAKDLASIREEQKKYEEESARRALERVRQFGQEADAIRDQLDPTRALFRELERVDLLRKEGFITLEEGREASRRAVEKLTSTVTEQQRLTVAANDSAQAFKDMGYTAASALEDILVKGGGARDVLRALGQDLQRILIRQSVTKPLADTAGNLFANLFGKGPNVTSAAAFNEVLNLQGFANGGSFTVGGAGGTDSQLVAFRATPGEEVSIRTPGQQAGGGTFYIDARGADAAAISRLEGTIRALNGSIERRAVAAVFNANVRGVRV